MLACWPRCGVDRGGQGPRWHGSSAPGCHLLWIQGWAPRLSSCAPFGAGLRGQRTLPTWPLAPIVALLRERPCPAWALGLGGRQDLQPGPCRLTPGPAVWTQWKCRGGGSPPQHRSTWRVGRSRCWLTSPGWLSSVRSSDGASRGCLAPANRNPSICPSRVTKEQRRPERGLGCPLGFGWWVFAPVLAFVPHQTCLHAASPSSF